MRMREARPEDGGFLMSMLLEAFNWAGRVQFSEDDIASDLHLRRYLEGWGRATDFGQIATHSDGTDVGAAWARLLPADEPRYGYVAFDIPELTIAVASAYRGRGIGRQLLQALVQEAQSRKHRALSLSVEDGNDAKRLYEQCGFRAVGRAGNADTMLLALPHPSSPIG
jgi:ribosomal protein S18 acetylase RimI-like enzyme